MPRHDGGCTRLLLPARRASRPLAAGRRGRDGHGRTRMLEQRDQLLAKVLAVCMEPCERLEEGPRASRQLTRRARACVRV
eukprot:1159584-Prymnesium_polylepis.1